MPWSFLQALYLPLALLLWSYFKTVHMTIFIPRYLFSLTAPNKHETNIGSDSVFIRYGCRLHKHRHLLSGTKNLSRSGKYTTKRRYFWLNISWTVIKFKDLARIPTSMSALCIEEQNIKAATHSSFAVGSLIKTRTSPKFRPTYHSCSAVKAAHMISWKALLKWRGLYTCCPVFKCQKLGKANGPERGKQWL